MKSFNARNPLSIIALFISLIYGISALLLGASVENLTIDNQDRLVIFVIFFPVLVLLAFLYLVRSHHRKLYSPSDYRTDESFLSSSDPAAIGQKYMREGGVAEDSSHFSMPEGKKANEKESADVKSIKPTEPKSQGAKAKAKSSQEKPGEKISTGKPSTSAAYAYLTDGLVMQELQSEFQSPILREAVLRMPNGRITRVDGLVHGPSGSVITEIKLVRSGGPVSPVISSGIKQLSFYLNNAHGALDTPVSGILVLVLDGSFDSEEIERIQQKAMNAAKDAISVRVFEVNKLLRKYGFS